MDYKKALAEGYSRSASDYDATVGMDYAMALWRLLPRVREEPRAVLDAGCGTGICLLEIAAAVGPGCKLVGIDLSPGMLEVARRKAEEFGLPVEFEIGDIESLGRADEEFDLVVCNGAYHWASDRRRAARELARVLRPGGQLLLTSIAEPGFEEWIGLVQEVFRDLFDGGRPWFPELPNEEAVRQELEEAGLEVEHIENRIQITFIRDIDGFLQGMSIVAPNWQFGVPRESRGALVDAIKERLRAHLPQGFRYTAATLEAVARKR